uniref:LD16736p n=1 Tax=Drosophila melanogaster TaxID=7227 RepID=Q8MSX0_DROME|nr:LD16736p [Drosophila melanogaster]
MSETYDYLFKFLIIGSAGSGKSCLLHHFIESKFKDDSSHTIGVEFRLADCERGRQVGKATDMGHSRSGEIPIGDKIVLSRSSRSSPGLRCHFAGLFQCFDKLAE